MRAIFHHSYGLATVASTHVAEMMSATSAAVDAWAACWAVGWGSRTAMNVANEATATTAPAGKPNRITLPTKPSLARSLLGGSERMKAGMPIVNHPVIVTWMGWKGKGTANSRTRIARIDE